MMPAVAGKLNSLIFNGKIGNQVRDFLINLCLVKSTCTEPVDSVHEQTEFSISMENLGLDL